MACQYLDFFSAKRDCMVSRLLEDLLSVRGYGSEDLQTPPGQECSNGSLILLAVVLWRIFFGKARPPGAPRTPEQAIPATRI